MARGCAVSGARLTDEELAEISARYAKNADGYSRSVRPARYWRDQVRGGLAHADREALLWEVESLRAARCTGPGETCVCPGCAELLSLVRVLESELEDLRGKNQR